MYLDCSKRASAIDEEGTAVIIKITHQSYKLAAPLAAAAKPKPTMTKLSTKMAHITNS